MEARRRAPPMDTTSTERIASKPEATGAAPGAPAAATAATQSQAPPRAKSGGSRKRVLGVVAIVAAVAGATYYLHQRHFEETDDAQIDGDISSVGARVAGTVAS